MLQSALVKSCDTLQRGDGHLGHKQENFLGRQQKRNILGHHLEKKNET